MFVVAWSTASCYAVGFFKDRGVILNWALFLAATAFGVGHQRNSCSRDDLVIALTAAEVVVLWRPACRVRLRRTRRSEASEWVNELVSSRRWWTRSCVMGVDARGTGPTASSRDRVGDRA
jgi:hypothetical protein